MVKWRKFDFVNTCINNIIITIRNSGGGWNKIYINELFLFIFIYIDKSNKKNKHVWTVKINQKFLFQ